MKIIVDLDGVVWDIHSILLEEYNKLTNSSLKRENLVWESFSYDTWEIVYRKTIKRIKEFKIIDEKIPEYLLELNKDHYIIILTNGWNKLFDIIDKLKSIEIFPGKHYKELIKDSSGVSKTDYDFDILIDDCPIFAEEITKFKNKNLLLFNQPWNREILNSRNVIRIYNWNKIFEVIEKWKK